MDYELIKTAVMLVNTFGTVAVAVYTWIATRDKDNSQHIKAVEATLTKAISEHSSRLDKMEMHVKYLPTQQELSELQGDMQAMQATQEAIQRDMAATRLSLNRIEDFLMKK